MIPFISIIMPAKNEEKNIEKCLSSLVSQNYPKDHFEIIVVDNGSTDRTKEIAAGLASLVLYITDVNIGAVRNYGALHAKGSILAFTDADCLSHPNWLSMLGGQLENEEIGAIGGSCLPKPEANWVELAWTLTSKPTQGSANILAGSSFSLKRETFENAGRFNENLKSNEDTNLSFKIKSLKKTLLLIPEAAKIHLGYPDRISTFAKRQFWHSLSMSKANSGLLKDKTYTFTLLYLLVIASIIPAMFIRYNLVELIFSILVLSPAVLTVKRIKRSAQEAMPPKLILQAYALDFVYSFSRAAGLFLSYFSAHKNK